MEDKNELSDIVLEKDDNKAVKTKRILVIVALLILVFLLVLVVMRVINKPEATNTQSKLVLPPEPVVKEVDTKNDDQLFKQVPIIEEEASKKESFEEMVRSLKEKEINKQTTIPEETQTQVKETVKEELPKVTQKAPVEQIVQPVVEKKAAEIVPQPKVQAKTKSTEATSGIYVQVGATSKLTPSKKFLDTIASQNYEYKLLPITVKDTKVTKILIGPFANTEDAKKALANIKTSINKDAFIYRVK
ncbi:MAG TPA: sporulation protein [Sulfurospirillum sp. UBA11407]|jgi:DedD protein|nr:MAG TPA: sporulation protein [Sulfurospirillum sp. UBA11407]DAB34933.1 MAG TPA: sporulation protein [Sulfurospirillum sp. UBA12182]